jgi:hypothetical protein
LPRLSIYRRSQEQGVFVGRSVIASAAAGDLKTEAFVESQSGKIRCANFKYGFLGMERLAPIQGSTQQRSADAAASDVWPHGKIQNFKVSCHAPRNQESTYLALLFRHPARHLAASYAIVIPRCPLRDFRTCALYCNDGLHIRWGEEANLRGFQGNFQ